MIAAEDGRKRPAISKKVSRESFTAPVALNSVKPCF